MMRRKISPPGQKNSFRQGTLKVRGCEMPKGNSSNAIHFLFYFPIPPLSGSVHLSLGKNDQVPYSLSGFLFFLGR